MSFSIVMWPTHVLNVITNVLNVITNAVHVCNTEIVKLFGVINLLYPVTNSQSGNMKYCHPTLITVNPFLLNIQHLTGQAINWCSFNQKIYSVQKNNTLMTSGGLITPERSVPTQVPLSPYSCFILISSSRCSVTKPYLWLVQVISFD